MIIHQIILENLVDKSIVTEPVKTIDTINKLVPKNLTDQKTISKN